ncbi:MAG: hypothetical protein OEN20_02335 [Gammaproteobacteria bacterium]|nr:hypothetical protein [Gammaproteobacteria bacterium]
MRTITTPVRGARVLDTATVASHGDQGSPISLHDPLAEFQNDLNSDDIVDRYSAMFATKVPGVALGYTRIPEPSPNLVAPLLRVRPPVGENHVYLLDKRYRQMPRPAIDASVWRRL